MFLDRNLLGFFGSMVTGFFVFFLLIADSNSKENLPGKEKYSSEAKQSPRMNLHDFMEKYTKPAHKHFLKTGDSVALVQVVQSIPELAISEQRADWERIVKESLESGKPESSCRSCHQIYKRDYKKKYRKREVLVPESLLNWEAIPKP
jgi:hypothetical protein